MRKDNPENPSLLAPMAVLQVVCIAGGFACGCACMVRGDFLLGAVVAGLCLLVGAGPSFVR